MYQSYGGQNNNVPASTGIYYTLSDTLNFIVRRIFHIHVQANVGRQRAMITRYSSSVSGIGRATQVIAGVRLFEVGS